MELFAERTKRLMQISEQFHCQMSELEKLRAAVQLAEEIRHGKEPIHIAAIAPLAAELSVSRPGPRTGPV
jgi:hypothetical protein